jgi:bacterioferritin
MSNSNENLFLRDIQKLREDAKKSLEDGAVTSNYKGDLDTAIDLLQSALATEIVCVLRYTMNAISVQGLNSKSVAAEFTEHAADEQRHMPNFDPAGLAARSSTEYGGPGELIELVKQNLIAERIAVEHYRDLIGYFTHKDPTTRLMLEHILEDEEDHATDMHDLLVAHEGSPMLK